MFPFWEIAIAPVLDAVRPRTVIEIGALRGETTTLMLERLGADAELHVIDPTPEFDPAEHERAFPGRYIFHRDISHNVLPHLAPADVALIDGDHNWYTVYHELTMLSATARNGGQPLPVLLMHDVGWPYGRRDLYYAPERIPEQFRQPYDQRGMRPHRKQLLPTSRRPESDYEQCDHRGRWTERRDDRPRRLHSGIRPAAATRRVAHLLRPGDRRRRGPAAGKPRARRRHGSARRRREQTGAARARGVCTSPGDDLPAQRLSPPRGATRKGGEPIPESPEVRIVGRALPRERGAARVPRRLHRAQADTRSDEAA